MSNPFTDLLKVVRAQQDSQVPQSHSGLLIIGEVPAQVVVEPQTPPAEPEPEYISPSWSVSVVAEDDPRKDSVFIDHESNSLTGYFSEYATDIQFNEEYYRAHVWNRGFDTVGVDGLFSFQIGIELIPTCKFYAPSSESLNSGSTPHPDYHYYNVIDISVCLNPTLARSKSWAGVVHSHCPHKIQNTCSEYQSHEWIVTHHARSADVEYRIESNFLSDRHLAYRIVSLTGPVKKVHVVVQINDEQDVNRIIDDFQELVGSCSITATGNTMTPSFDEAPVSFVRKLIATEV